MARASSGLDGVRPQARTAEKRFQIEQVAVALFAERGYDRVTMRDIASSANVQLGTLSYFYREKQALYDIVVRTALHQFQTKILEPLKGTTPGRPALTKLIQTLAQLHSEHTHYDRIIAREGIEGTNSRLMKVGSDAFKVIREALVPTVIALSGQSMSLKSAERRVRYIITMLYHLAVTGDLYPGETFDSKEIDAELEDLLLNGFSCGETRSCPARPPGKFGQRPSPARRAFRIRQFRNRKQRCCASNSCEQPK